MSTAEGVADFPSTPPRPWFSNLRALIDEALFGLGDWLLFSVRAASGIFTHHFQRKELLRNCVDFGVSSFNVVIVTGLFIGMVLSVQVYTQLHFFGLDTSLGGIIHVSVLRELGPILTSVMLAGRVGTAMAAQLATMRVTEQIDALSCLGVDPVRYLVGPRFVSCLLMIPMLTIIADAMGVVGSTFICVKIYHIDSFHYWEHSANAVRMRDLFLGIFKSVIFGGVMCLICCYRGFHSQPGAVGVGKAATNGFVSSFIAILILDFFIAMSSNMLKELIWPSIDETLG